MAVTSPSGDTGGPVEHDSPPAWRRHLRQGAWVVMAVGFVLFILFGSVAAISYRYYSFSGRVVRLDPRRSLIDIWRDQIAALPDFSVGWLPGAVVIACLVISIVGAIAGVWMLLVQADEPRRAARGG